MANLNIIGRSKLWLTISAVITATAVIVTVMFGLNPGIDFTGGALMTIAAEGASQEGVRQVVVGMGYEPIVQTSSDGNMLVRVPPITEEEHQALLAGLRTAFGEVVEHKFDSVGPVVGAELKKETATAIVIILALIAAYIAWAFRKVSEPVASWKYGFVTLIAAFHDVVIPVGVFAILGKLYGYHADTAFVAALLTILGYSINDTIVVFDRTRENLVRHRHGAMDFAATVNKSINETLGRSLNTTLTTALPLVAIVIFGGETTRPFAVTLLVGILSGAYSSIFLASPLLVLSEKWGKG